MNDRMKLICVFNYDGKYIDFLFLDYFKYYSKKINKQTKKHGHYDNILHKE